MNRRRFLQSLLATGVAAPLSMGGFARMALAQGSAKLKVVFAVIPDGFGVDAYGGYNKGLWFPETGGLKDTGNFQLNEMSKHLAAYKNQSLFLKGLIVGSGTGGHNAWTTILRDTNASKTSIDLLLGDKLRGTNALMKRLYSGPHATVGAAWNVSYDGNAMIVPEINPYQLFEQVYGSGAGGMGGGSQPQSRAHLFDNANSRIQQLRANLGGSERAKLDTHLDAIEQVVTDLNASVPVAGGCTPGDAEPAAGLVSTSADYRDEVTRAHSNIVASALSCGSTRVATLQIGRSADPVAIKSVSATRNPHDCAHRYGSVTEWRDSRAWYVQQVKYLLDKLNAMPDPDVPTDSLLAHTLVVFTSEMADGAPEHMQDVPVTLIGGASGLLKHQGGRVKDLYDQGERSHWRMGKAVDMQRVWTTIGQAAGISVPYGASSIPGIFTNVN
ncbi:DUF1552 domain-containing protein [Simiduia sp. 21SJ11W-1]|uniref:DUF1552 domain-containing protein n=1 Tax=Simiduia sp. 21SJ11W-1 TaxID=2909669 RepID=UPI0020A0DC5A|nr:DUF1552 domain-containing protein [Simiduia sp. 21SJ11W-1]UTA46831.1 DUF1552 domain-containing protein [Simiduia sp. 21SJ11W-1]